MNVRLRRPQDVRLGRPWDVRSRRPRDGQIGSLGDVLGTLEGDVLGTSWGLIFACWVVPFLHVFTQLSFIFPCEYKSTPRNLLNTFEINYARDKLTLIDPKFALINVPFNIFVIR